MKPTIPLVIMVMVVVVSFALAVVEMPTYGQVNPTFNYVYDHYIDRGVEETGAVNVVAQILVDYRAYDTLIETVVLFTAIVATILVLKTPHADEEGEHDG